MTNPTPGAGMDQQAFNQAVLQAMSSIHPNVQPHGDEFTCGICRAMETMRTLLSSRTAAPQGAEPCNHAEPVEGCPHCVWVTKFFAEQNAYNEKYLASLALDSTPSRPDLVEQFAQLDAALTKREAAMPLTADWYLASSRVLELRAAIPDYVQTLRAKLSRTATQALDWQEWLASNSHRAVACDPVEQVVHADALRDFFATLSPPPEPVSGAKVDSFQSVLNKVCGEIPAGFQLDISCENGAAWVDVIDPEGNHLALPDSADLSMEEQVLQALSACHAPTEGGRE
jgi:hypothetical protein